MRQALFLGIDLGASALKACVINARGHVSAQSSVALATQHPHPHYCEQTPAHWVRALRQCLPRLWQEGIAANQIDAISVTAGAHTAVLTDARGKPLAPAILWSDMRSTAEAEQLQTHAARFIRHNGNRPNPTWTAAHLRWRARHTQAVYKQAQRLYLAKDWLRAQLSDHHDWHTDMADAIGTLLADRQTGQWHKALVRLASWQNKKLPPIAPALEQVATVSKRASTMLGLRQGTPIICGSNDTSVELLCANACRNGAATIKLASAGVVSLCDSMARPHPPISLYPHLIDGLDYHAAGMNSCTTTLDWACKALGATSLTALEAQARASTTGAGGLCFYPYLNGERAPLWSSDWRAAWIGVSSQSSRADLARAVYEGISYALYEIWCDVMARTGSKHTSLSLLGGGSRSQFWAQMLADVFGKSLRIVPQQSAAYGAALLAATAAGAYASLAAAPRATANKSKQLHPQTRQHKIYQSRFEDFLRSRKAAHRG